MSAVDQSLPPLYIDLIRQGAHEHADRVAIIFGTQSRTYGQVNALANQLANALIATGARYGEKLAILVDNGLLSIPLEFACVKAGINRVPLNSRLSLDEQCKMLEETSCRFLIHGPGLTHRAENLKTAFPELSFFGLGKTISGGRDLLALAKERNPNDPHVDAAADDIILTIFTSGTTGTLKAVQHTQASYAGICHNILLNLITVKPDDIMLHAASLIHASGVFVLPFWVRGALSVIMSSFDVKEYLSLIETAGVTTINLVPTMLQMLMEQPEFETTDISRLRQVIYGASPMPRPILEKAMALWGKERFWQYYGQTECPLCITVLRPEHHIKKRLDACGLPASDVDIRLIDDKGHDVAVGDIGEIVVRGPSMMVGYYNAPDLNANTMMKGGWLRTRDMGQFDEDGFLYLRDRSSDMIITGGYNVYPREIENILMAHPAILECAVIGTPDTKWVEAVTAVIVLKPGCTVTDSALISFVGRRVASYKKPRKIIRMGEIPKTAIGKLKRKALRDQINETS